MANIKQVNIKDTLYDIHDIRIPEFTAADEGAVLKIINGKLAWVHLGIGVNDNTAEFGTVIPAAEGVAY